MMLENRDDRFTWNKGEAVITDREGNPIDLDKLDEDEDENGGEVTNE